VAHVILFGGGDGGGIIIGPEGIKPIPPWTPRLQRQLRAVSALAQVAKDKTAGVVVSRELAPLLTKLTADAMKQVAAIAGKGEHSVVYVDDDGGGFTCGTPPTKPPIPFPRGGIAQAFGG
jgi:hypothetical protein